MLESLVKNVFTDYGESVRPFCRRGSTVNVDLNLALRQIIDIDEPHQFLDSNIWIRMVWTDCRLTWNTSHYNGIDHVVLPQNRVWTPDITLYDNSANELHGIKDFRPAIYSDGTIYYNFPSIISSLCKIDVTYFPFDTQTCKLKFGSWIHHGLELDVVNRSLTGDISNYVSNGEWDIISVPLTRHVEYYNCCEEPYPDVTFYVILKRRPLFYLMNLMFPCMLITAVAILGFLLPPDSGEKVSLEITVLLSLAVFLLVVSETMPPTSEDFPYIGIYFACAMMLVSLSCLMTVIVLNLHFKGIHGREVPYWIRTVFLRYLAKVVFVKTELSSCIHPLKVQVQENVFQENHLAIKTKNSSRNNETNLQLSECNKQETTMEEIPTLGFDKLIGSSDLVCTLRKQLESLHRIETVLFDKKEHENSNYEWQRVAQVLDRLFLVLFIFVSVGSTLAILIPGVSQ
ncbi:hypothetical protein ScPMuIL_017384 [Solemya velum]